MGGGAWKAPVHGVAKSWTRLSDCTFTLPFHALEEEMATHSGVLAWRISGTGEPGGLPSMGSHRVRHDWSNLAAAAAVLNHYFFFLNFPVSHSKSHTSFVCLLVFFNLLKIIFLSTAKRRYPTSEVRGRSREDPITDGQRPRGATPRLRSRAAAKSARLWWRRNGPRGANPRPGSSGCMGAGGPRRATPRSRSGGEVLRRYPLSKARSSSCALLEQPWRDTPRPR